MNPLNTCSKSSQMSQIETSNDSQNLQNCVNKLTDWTAKWLLKFNGPKCGVMHLGHNNPNYDYHISEDNISHKLEISKSEKDLGVFVDSDLNFSEHIKSKVNKHNAELQRKPLPEN